VVQPQTDKSRSENQKSQTTLCGDTMSENKADKPEPSHITAWQFIQQYDALRWEMYI